MALRANTVLHFVGEYILTEWGCYLAAFEAFRKKLVKEGVAYCKKHGRTALSHIEGFHTGLSGMNFLKTLMKEKHRNHLVHALLRA